MKIFVAFAFRRCGEILCVMCQPSDWMLAALGADLYAGSQYGVSTNNLSQLAPRLRNDVLGTRATVVTGDALGQRFRTNIQANHFLHRPLPSWEWPNAGSRCEPQGRAPSAQFVTKI